MSRFSVKRWIPAAAPGAQATGMLCLIVTSVGWGLNWPAMKMLLTEWPPLFARGTAGVTAAIVIGLAARLAGQSLHVPAGQAARLATSAFVNVFAWMGFSTLALRWLKAGQAALLVYTMPVWVILLAWLILGKRPALKGMLGLVLCFIGLTLLFSGQEMAIRTDQIPGLLFALAAAMLFALGNVLLKPPVLPPLASVTWQLLIGCLPMVAFGWFAEHPDLSALSSRGWMLMAYMTAVPMGLCYVTWFAALRRLAPETASLSTLLTPVVGVLAAAIALDEPFGGKELVAIVIALAGVWLSLRGKRTIEP
ncbi:DMT family transporter [Noviherbaspirillum sp. ST9]|uniref:DMT family transporter n=1 Tax=Noviherbaspirillum sp. ST9 TaxID=3401606 RepID=UPI003B586C0A